MMDGKTLLMIRLALHGILHSAWPRPTCDLFQIAALSSLTLFVLVSVSFSAVAAAPKSTPFILVATPLPVPRPHCQGSKESLFPPSLFYFF